MSVKIRNLTSSPLWLSFNSGATLRLAPGETSGEVGEVEVTNNAKLDKLQGQRMIAIEPIEQKTPAPAKGRAKTHAPTKATAPAQKETATPAETEPAAAAGEEEGVAQSPGRKKVRSAG